MVLETSMQGPCASASVSASSKLAPHRGDVESTSPRWKEKLENQRNRGARVSSGHQWGALILPVLPRKDQPSSSLDWPLEQKGTKLHFKSPTAERRHVLCVGVGGDRTHAARPQRSRACPLEQIKALASLRVSDRQQRSKQRRNVRISREICRSRTYDDECREPDEGFALQQQPYCPSRQRPGLRLR